MQSPEPVEQTEPDTTQTLPKYEVPAQGFYLSGENSVVGKLAKIKVREGDTLADLARHYDVGYQHISDANPDIDMWIPRDGDAVLLPLSFILPDAPRKGVVINLAAMRLFYFQEGKKPVLTWPIGIGREGKSTPVGAMSIVKKTKNPAWYPTGNIRKAHAKDGDPLPAMVPAGPNNPLGQYALYLSKPAYLIHGTDKPFSIGIRASNGCIRLYPEDIERAFKYIPTETSVLVVNQPYLLGWQDNILYLEAHKPFEEIDTKQARDNLSAKLRLIEKKHPKKLDWKKVEVVLKEAKGIPIPIFTQTPNTQAYIANLPFIEHPNHLNGQPPPVTSAESGWLVRSSADADGYRVKRLAAQLNHLGPRVPAKVVSKDRKFQVVAGPFPDEAGARKVQAFLKEDFSTASDVTKPLKATLKPAKKVEMLKPELIW